MNLGFLQIRFQLPYVPVFRLPSMLSSMPVEWSRVVAVLVSDLRPEYQRPIDAVAEEPIIRCTRSECSEPIHHSGRYWQARGVNSLRLGKHISAL